MGLPVGLFLFQLWGCPASAVAVAGIRCRVLQARPFFGTVSLYLFQTLFSSPLMLPGVVTTFRVCLPRALALRQVLEAMLAEGALESPSIHGPAFLFVSLPCGRVVLMG